MRWRRIGEDDVVDCIDNPEVSQELPLGEVNSWKVGRGSWFKIVHVEEADARVVITVVHPAKEPKGTRP